MKLLVTGGLGFIGSNFIFKLLENPNFLKGLNEISERGLTFDLQLIPEFMEIIAPILKKVPNLNVVLCHAGSPYNRTLAGLSDWSERLKDLSNLSQDILPANAKISYSGSSKEYFESGNSLELTILFAILIVYLVLSAQFESFRNPLAIILTVPIAMTAGLYTLFLTGTSLNVYSQIGFLMLIGLIAKNGILVVEFANQLRDEGMSVDEAIFESSMIRLRPVLMTTISTMLGAIPLVLSSGAGAESRYSMAIVVLGGITLSSLITLYLIPALYRLIENKKV